MFTYYFCVLGLICTRISEVVGPRVKSLLKNDFHSHQTKMVLHVTGILVLGWSSIKNKIIPGLINFTV